MKQIWLGLVTCYSDRNLGPKQCPEYAAVISGFLKRSYWAVYHWLVVKYRFGWLSCFFWDIFVREVCLLVCTENKHHSQPISWCHVIHKVLFSLVNLSSIFLLLAIRCLEEATFFVFDRKIPHPTLVGDEKGKGKGKKGDGKDGKGKGGKGKGKQDWRICWKLARVQEALDDYTPRKINVTVGKSPSFNWKNIFKWVGLALSS